MLHLDTSIVVEFLRGNESVGTKLLSSNDPIAISSIVLAELLFGAAVSANPRNSTEDIWKFRSAIDVVPFDESAAQEYARIRAELRRAGRQPGDADMLIAATALAHGATLVTHNLKHFEHIRGLHALDWVTGG